MTYEQVRLTNVRFYDEGYADGFAHGALHGLYEGRALGQEKAYELWEEVGYYEGFAQTYLDVSAQSGGSAPRSSRSARTRMISSELTSSALSHARQLLDLIRTFPTINPSSAPDGSTPTAATAETREEVDLPALLASIRARYRLLCSSLGVRGRLVAAPNGQTQAAGTAVEGIEGPMKGVDTSQLKF